MSQSLAANRHTYMLQTSDISRSSPTLVATFSNRDLWCQIIVFSQNVIFEFSRFSRSHENPKTYCIRFEARISFSFSIFRVASGTFTDRLSKGVFSYYYFNFGLESSSSGQTRCNQTVRTRKIHESVRRVCLGRSPGIDEFPEIKQWRWRGGGGEGWYEYILKEFSI